MQQNIPSLETLIQALQSLPEATQQQYISELMTKISADTQWDTTFNSPESLQGLKRLAIQIETEIVAGNYGNFYEELDQR